MFSVFGFYKFYKLKSLKKHKSLLQKYLVNKNIRGTIILSREGINATISGNLSDLVKIKSNIKKMFGFKKFDSDNFSKSKFQPFSRGKVKIKNEVVPMDLHLTLKNKSKSNHVEPLKWNSLIKNKDTIILDTRKPFEYDVGTFKGSVNPDVNNFR